VAAAVAVFEATAQSVAVARVVAVVAVATAQVKAAVRA
jgi:hypothetical protein